MPAISRGATPGSLLVDRQCIRRRRRGGPGLNVARQRAFVLRHGRLLSARAGIDPPASRGRGVAVRPGTPSRWRRLTRMPSLPYWAFAWGRRTGCLRTTCATTPRPSPEDVYSISASGSGLCAIAAMKAGASDARPRPPSLRGGDRPQRAGERPPRRVVRRDVLDDEPPDIEVSWRATAGTRHPRRTRSADSGAPATRGSTTPWATRVDATCPATLIGLATYDVRTTTELEDLDRKQGHVYTLPPAATSSPSVEPALG